jgi:hypothetical protein
VEIVEEGTENQKNVLPRFYSEVEIGHTVTQWSIGRNSFV